MKSEVLDGEISLPAGGGTGISRACAVTTARKGAISSFQTMTPATRMNGVDRLQLTHPGFRPLYRVGDPTMDAVHDLPDLHGV